MVGSRPSPRCLNHRDQTRGGEAVVLAVLELKHAGDSEWTTKVEPAIRQKIPERVHDGNPAIELDPTKHVRTVTNDRIGAGVDDRVGPTPQFAARLLAKRFGRLGGMQRSNPFGAAVKGDDEKVHQWAKRIDDGRALLDIQEIIGEGIRGEPDEADDRHAVSVPYRVDRDAAERPI